MSMVLCYAWELSNFAMIPTLQGFRARLMWKRTPQGPSAPEDKGCTWRRILKRCYKTIIEVEIPGIISTLSFETNFWHPVARCECLGVLKGRRKF